MREEEGLAFRLQRTSLAAAALVLPLAAPPLPAVTTLARTATHPDAWNGSAEEGVVPRIETTGRARARTIML